MLCDCTRGQWSHDEVQRAYCAVSYEHTESMQNACARVKMELYRVDEASKDCVVKDEPRAKERRARAKHSNVVHKRESDVKVEANVEADATRHGLVRRIEERFGLSCTLIGSGIFSCSSDVDIVVEMKDAPSLEDAYERVARVTNWTPNFTTLDTNGTNVLIGWFEGAQIDAQIWRGCDESEAEKRTLHSLQVTRIIQSSTDYSHRELICAFHDWITKNDLKGNIACKLSGIGVTSLAIISKNQANCTSLDSLIRHLAQKLACEFPFMELSSDYMENERGVRVDRKEVIVPLSVVVNGSNVTKRMTVSSTRHLIRMFQLGTSADAKEWRKRNMFVALKIEPIDASAAAMSLHMSLAKLDNHPLIDSIHVETSDNMFIILCTLTYEYSLDKYGFKPTDNISFCVANRESVTVTRNGKQFPLFITPHSDAKGNISVNGGFLPNAPFLTIDTFTKFDSNLWRMKYAIS